MTPLERGVAKVKLTFPVPLIVRLSAPLSCKTSPDPSNPEIDPPTVKMLPQVTWTFATLAKAVPVALVTLQFCMGLAGCVLTVTL